MDSQKQQTFKSAFLQGRPISRNVFIQPPPEAGIASGYVWKLNRCLYGLNDAARQFFNSVKEALMLLQCHQSHLDPSMFCYYQDDIPCGAIVCHMTTSYMLGNQSLTGLRDRFLAGKLEETTFKYVGFNVHQSSIGITLDQNDYVEYIDSVSVDPSRTSQKLEKLTALEHTVYAP